jgi:hypothetical protein
MEFVTTENSGKTAKVKVMLKTQGGNAVNGLPGPALNEKNKIGAHKINYSQKVKKISRRGAEFAEKS